MSQFETLGLKNHQVRFSVSWFTHPVVENGHPTFPPGNTWTLVHPASLYWVNGDSRSPLASSSLRKSLESKVLSLTDETSGYIDLEPFGTREIFECLQPKGVWQWQGFCMIVRSILSYWNLLDLFNILLIFQYIIVIYWIYCVLCAKWNFGQFDLIWFDLIESVFACRSS